ncbi:MAG: cellulase family glycosylhydrolase [Acidobacteriota bacterium]
MIIRLYITLALLVLLAAPCGGCAAAKECPFPPASVATPAIPDGFGVNIHFTEPKPGEMKMIAAAGVRWVRMDFKWDLTETAKGTYDFTPYEHLLSALKSSGLRALLILDYTNPLYDGGAPPRTEETRQAFARWAVAAAKHFDGHEIIWETWNEPNHQVFWRPRPNVNEYAALALAVGRAFRADAPNAKLIGPAVSEMDFAFLEGSFKKGVLSYWSAVSVHPYLRSDPENVTAEYCRLRDLIKSYAGDKDNKENRGNRGNREIAIISSEWGYSSGWPGMSEEKQGQMLARQWLINLANGIPLSIWYDWRDDGSDPNDPEHHFGMVSNAYHEGRDPVYDAKPAYLAAKTLATFFSGYRFEKRLVMGSIDDYVFVFRNGASLRYAAWTTATREHRIIVPLSPGQYTAVTHSGADAGLIMANQNGVPITLTRSPIYLR